MSPGKPLCYRCQRAQSSRLDDHNRKTRRSVRVFGVMIPGFPNFSTTAGAVLRVSADGMSTLTRRLNTLQGPTHRPVMAHSCTGGDAGSQKFVTRHSLETGSADWGTDFSNRLATVRSCAPPMWVATPRLRRSGLVRPTLSTNPNSNGGLVPPDAGLAPRGTESDAKARCLAPPRGLRQRRREAAEAGGGGLRLWREVGQSTLNH